MLHGADGGYVNPRVSHRSRKEVAFGDSLQGLTLDRKVDTKYVKDRQ